MIKQVDIYRRKWIYFFGIPLFYYLEYVKTSDEDKLPKRVKNKKYIL